MRLSSRYLYPPETIHSASSRVKYATTGGDLVLEKVARFQEWHHRPDILNGTRRIRAARTSHRSNRGKRFCQHTTVKHITPTSDARRGDIQTKQISGNPQIRSSFHKEIDKSPQITSGMLFTKCCSAIDDWTLPSSQKRVEHAKAKQRVNSGEMRSKTKRGMTALRLVVQP
jgi:hypothetical protein